MARGWSLLGSVALHSGLIGAAIAAGIWGGRWEPPAVSLNVPPPAPISYETVVPVERPMPVFEKVEETPQPLTPVEATYPFEAEHPVEESDFVAVEPLVPVPDKPMPTLERPIRTAQAITNAAPPSNPSPEVDVKESPVELYNPPPSYPTSALRRRIEGEALVEVTIGEDGRCIAPRLIECTGSDLFGETALATIAQWKYRPAFQNGKPVSVSHRVRFVFRLK
jgi:protein TonB